MNSIKEETGGRRFAVEASGAPRTHGHVRQVWGWTDNNTVRSLNASPSSSACDRTIKRRVAAWSRGSSRPPTPTPGVPAALSQTFLSSTAFRGEDDENGQEESPGPCRSPAHHYRSAHSSLQSECIMLASVPAAASTCTEEKMPKVILGPCRPGGGGGVCRWAPR